MQALSYIWLNYRWQLMAGLHTRNHEQHLALCKYKEKCKQPQAKWCSPRHMADLGPNIQFHNISWCQKQLWSCRTRERWNWGRQSKSRILHEKLLTLSWFSIPLLSESVSQSGKQIASDNNLPWKFYECMRCWTFTLQLLVEFILPTA